MAATTSPWFGDRPIKRLVRYPIEGAIATLAFYLFRSIPTPWSAAALGRLGRWIGPRLPISRRARANLMHAFPEKTTAEIDRIVAAMWDHLGQTVAEFPAMDRLDTHDPERVEILRLDRMEALRDDGATGIMFAAHCANWEVPALAALQRDLPMIGVYRRANNPYVERLFGRARGWPDNSLVPKSAQGARKVFAEMKRGRHLVLMMDQKLNEGIAVPFFGRPAMTSTMVAKYALHFRCPVHPVSIVRTGLGRYRIEVEPALPLPDSGDAEADVRALTEAATARIEAWVRAHPEQWLWLHNRWGDG